LSFEINKLFYPKIIHWPRRAKCNCFVFFSVFQKNQLYSS